MSRETFTLPDLGEGLTEAQLVRWLVRPGDSVAVDAPVAEVETAKALVEVPSPFAGVVAELHGDEGATLAVGAPLISVSTGTAGVYVEEERAGSGNVLIGYGTGTRANGRRRRRVARPATPAVAERPAVSSPVVRKLAKDRGLDLTALRGTGPDGLITRADVERAAQPSGGTGPSRTGLGVAERIPLRGMRAAITEVLSRSRSEIPEATTWVDVDATELVRLRTELADGPGLLALVARFVVAGLGRYPVLNSTVDTERQEIHVFDGVNLGIATQTDRGLVVPVVRDAHRRTARQLDAELRRVTAAARDGSATAADLGSGSFTLNNYGSFGVDGSAAIINHPEVAILGMGRILERPWVVAGQVVPRHVTQLSLVFDHRVCDGGTAAGFLRFVADTIESPASALADL
ncbi:dihydrolipoamide acetyltransferase family protein [Prauserella muralis]|uniref:Dihydrolipoamide acetyltransferase component of pyruvate dehydrogenase complex n=1 Tax=Prauserella muralis TaxID=588067 RepID=A0A2V4APX2_9PSEU|nr:dihydrolipoamide acetyltransferase family protein [Prauserella muralis]PXY22750.1 branched-chain alpha-keto acid dehydrogenase subunit E2 [Prauserella muralis]TWE28479.1 pyruvate dehydrogenase E2 component (dihydrolipoamide acetyltransferase) [Prauserella muralis]